MKAASKFRCLRVRKVGLPPLFRAGETLLENGNNDLNRYQTAYSKNAIPKQQLDTQQAR